MTNLLKHKMRSKSPGEIAGWIVLGIIAITALATLFGLIIMWLWNWLMVDIFQLKSITYWEGIGIFILFKILFGGLGSGCGSSSSPKDSNNHCKIEKKSDFSKWKHYDDFWKEEGDIAYKEYVKRMNYESDPESPE